MTLDMQRDKVKLFVVIGVLAVCALWLIIYAANSGPSYGKLHIPDSPAIQLVNDLNKKTTAILKFNDVGFAVLSEKPIKLKVVGAVRSDEDLDALKEWLKKTDSTHEFEFDVQVMGGEH